MVSVEEICMTGYNAGELFSCVLIPSDPPAWYSVSINEYLQRPLNLKMPPSFSICFHHSITTFNHHDYHLNHQNKIRSIIMIGDDHLTVDVLAKEL